MAKKIIRLTESELHRIVRESVSRILNICEDIEEGIDFDSKTRTVSYNLLTRTMLTHLLKIIPQKILK